VTDLTRLYSLGCSQKELEGDIFAKADSAERKALQEMKDGNVAEAVKLLSDFQEKVANHIVAKWWDFFHLMVAKYRDIVRSVDENRPYRSIAPPRLTRLSGSITSTQRILPMPFLGSTTGDGGWNSLGFGVSQGHHQWEKPNRRV
jgi:hypothetical protein